VTDPNCKVCFGIGWVCENHPDRVWDEELGCQCGAGNPCVCNRSADIDAGIEEPDVSKVLCEDVRREN
jgi:hypothetical protein